MDVLARFPRVWCPTCNKTQPMIFDVMKANDKNEHDARRHRLQRMQVSHRNAARAERPPGWRAYRQGRESTGNGGPGIRPSEGPNSNPARKTTPPAAGSQRARRGPEWLQPTRRKRTGMSTLRTHFTFRVDTCTPDGESIVEHVAGVEDYQVALATFRAACERWPGTPITLRQGARVIEDSRRLRVVWQGQRSTARAVTTKML